MGAGAVGRSHEVTDISRAGEGKARAGREAIIDDLIAIVELELEAAPVRLNIYARFVGDDLPPAQIFVINDIGGRRSIIYAIEHVINVRSKSSRAPSGFKHFEIPRGSSVRQRT